MEGRWRGRTKTETGLRNFHVINQLPSSSRAFSFALVSWSRIPWSLLNNRKPAPCSDYSKWFNIYLKLTFAKFSLSGVRLYLAGKITVKLVVDNVNDLAGFVNAVIFNCEQQGIKDREMKRTRDML